MTWEPLVARKDGQYKFGIRNSASGRRSVPNIRFRKTNFGGLQLRAGVVTSSGKCVTQFYVQRALDVLATYLRMSGAILRMQSVFNLDRLGKYGRLLRERLYR